MKKFKVRITEFYYIFLFLWALLTTISVASQGKFTFLIYNMSLLWTMIHIYIIAKVIIECRKISSRDIFVLIVLIIIGYNVQIHTKSGFLTAAFWFIAGARYIDWEKAVKYLFTAQAMAMAIIFLLCFIGVYEDVSKVNDGHSLGYINPNDLAVNVLQLSLMYLYLHREKLNFKFAIAFLILALVVYLITNSNTAMLLFIFTALGIILILSYKRKNLFSVLFSKPFIKCIRYFLVFFAACSVLFAVRRDIGESLLGDFHSRIPQMAKYFAFYPITLWGQPLINHYSPDYDWKIGLYTLDNAYLHLLLGFGIILFIVFLGLYFMYAKKVYRNKEYVVLLILVVYFALGFTETMLIRVQYNFTIFLLAEILWGDEKKFNFKRDQYVSTGESNAKFYKGKI